MKSRSKYALVLMLLLPVLAACSKPEPAAPVTEVAPAAEPVEAAPAAATPSTASETPPAATPVTAASNGAALVPGVDYVDIAGGAPFDPLDGKIEVTEVFGYVCPACNAFQPLVKSWKSKLPGDVRLTYVPAQFGPDWIPYAHAYYAAESLGLVDKTHDAVYNAIHSEKSLPGEGQRPTDGPIAAFYANYGVSAVQFTSAMNSFAVNGKLAKAKQYALRSQITGTPSLIINGKYLVKGKSFEDMIRIADQLVAQERAARVQSPK